MSNYSLLVLYFSNAVKICSHNEDHLTIQQTTVLSELREKGGFNFLKLANHSLRMADQFQQLPGSKTDSGLSQ